MEDYENNNTYGTIRKRKSSKSQAPKNNPGPVLNDSTATPKRKKPLPKTPGGKENGGDNTRPVSCSKLSIDDMKKVLPTSPNSRSPSHVLSPKQRRVSKGKRSMSPRPARPKTWTMSDRFDPKVCCIVIFTLASFYFSNSLTNFI
jgi:hypothetical protein